MRSFRPPMLRMSCSWCIAWITEPNAEEQQRLEEGVREQMEHADRIAPQPMAMNM